MAVVELMIMNFSFDECAFTLDYLYSLNILPLRADVI